MKMAVTVQDPMIPEHIADAAPGRKDRAWVEIHLPSLSHNVSVLRGKLPKGCEIMAVIKANAYGHGDVCIARHLQTLGIGAYAVATIDEGIRLRKHGVLGIILILGFTDPMRSGELTRYRLTQTVADCAHARRLNDAKRLLMVHIKVDTGMHRLGEDAGNVPEIAALFRYEYLKVNGIYTHLCVPECRSEDDIAFTDLQVKRFYDLLNALKAQGLAIPKAHLLSSYGVINCRNAKADYARVGLALYGVPGTPYDQNDFSILRPVLALRTRVALVRSIRKGEAAGYGRQFVASRDTDIAVLSIGYADGVPRCLSDKGYVLIRGCTAPIIGRICMDQTMVDVTGLAVQCGDVATLIGRDGSAEISAAEMANRCGTITNEILSRLSDRLKRICLSD